MSDVQSLSMYHAFIANLWSPATESELQIRILQGSSRRQPSQVIMWLVVGNLKAGMVPLMENMAGGLTETPYDQGTHFPPQEALVYPVSYFSRLLLTEEASCPGYCMVRQGWGGGRRQSPCPAHPQVTENDPRPKLPQISERSCF